MILFRQNNNGWILASASSKRAEHLQRYGFRFDIIPANINEQTNENESVIDFAARMAEEKAKAVFERYNNAEIIIGADTIFDLDSKIIGKPKDKQQALEILSQLNGSKHYVHTGVCVLIKREEPIKFISSSEVVFYKYPNHILQSYVDTEECLGKSGACSIEGLGAFLVKSIKGSWTSITGFPIEQFINHALERNLISTID